MRISDWSSDVCSSDLPLDQFAEALPALPPPPVKVGLLLPLSGSRADVGQALLNAAQLALFDLGGERFTLVVRDTKGTPEGAAAAAEAALAEQAVLLLGPLFATSAEAVKPIVDAAEVPMITFRSEEHTSELQSLMRISYDVFFLKKKNKYIES